MGRAFSDDLRCRILEAYARGGVSLRLLAERYAVSFEYVRKIRKQQLRSGRLERVRQRRHGPERRGSCRSHSGRGRTAAGRDARRTRALDRRSGWRSVEPIAGLADAHTAGAADEKKSLHAIERDTAINLQRRVEFLDRVRTIPSEKLIFLDESGVT